MAELEALYKDVKTLEGKVRTAGKLAVIDLEPLTEVEALGTHLQLIYLDGPMAILWSEEYCRPVFLMSEGECDPDEDCNTQIQVTQFSADILSTLDCNSSAIQKLMGLGDSTALRDYSELLDELRTTEKAYRQMRFEPQSRGALPT